MLSSPLTASRGNCSGINLERVHLKLTRHTSLHLFDINRPFCFSGNGIFMMAVAPHGRHTGLEC